MSQQKETERVREIFDASAVHYDKGMAFTEKLFFGDGRAWACSQARGQVLEIAIGTGRNLPFYQADVEITGIEISPAMLEIARQRAQSLGREVELVVGDAQALPFADQRFEFKARFQDQFGNPLTNTTGELVFKLSPDGGI